MMSFEKKRANTTGEVTDDRPMTHLGLGDKTHRPYRVQRQNINPRYMIGDKQDACRALRRAFAFRSHMHVQNPQAVQRPLCDDSVSFLRFQVTEQHHGHE